MAAPVVVVGSGGREAAIAAALLRSPTVGEILVAPGNGGTATLAPGRVRNVPAAGNAAIVALALESRAQFVFVGPEQPLAEGLADALKAAGVPCFGPSQAAAQIEASKAWSKDFMARHGIPTAAFKTFTDAAAAEAYIVAAGHPVVVKASGLAAGKGVVVAASTEEAVAAAKAMLSDASMGAAGSTIVVEEQVTGFEASVLAFCDGKTAVPMPPAADHKRIHEYDEGPNTGGMGAYAPTRRVPPALLARITAEVLQPAVAGLAAEGSPFVGVLYAGVMVNPSTGKIVTLEFNCRFGDPETQALLPLLSSDLADVVRHCIAGDLAPAHVHWHKGLFATAVVAAAAGYPGPAAKGEEVTVTTTGTGTAGAGGVHIFQAGTALDAATGKLVTAGGRVLAVTGVAPSLRAATQLAYAALEARVSFRGMTYRRDVGLGTFIRPRAAAQPLRVGVLGSTRGTDLPAVLAAIEAGALAATVSVVISNKEDAGILAKARDAGVPALAIPATGKSREAFDAEVSAALAAHGVDVVLCIGYMRILSAAFVARWRWRIINVHPSLLPAFAGGMDVDVHAAVLASGAPVTGCTVHIVTEEVDGGPYLVQRACAVAAGVDTPATLKEKVQALEGAALVEALAMYTDDAPFDILAALRAAQQEGAATGNALWEAAVAPRLPAGRLQRTPPAAAAAAASAATGGAASAAAAAAPLTYSAAGVDIDAGDALVERIKPLAKSTARAGADAELGGFGGLFDLKACGYTDPLLVSSTDGVGTKLKVAIASGKHDTVGIDLVAMSVNDLIVQGAEPLVFLDYYATGKLNVAEAADVVGGVAEGCRQAGCALVGGETAEMPSMYAHGDYDLAGFAVGAVERAAVLPRMDALAAGDVLLGLASNGLHSNGFSLVRKVVERSGSDLQAPPPFPSKHARLCDELLEPTRIYIKCLLPSIKAASGCAIKAMAHITGGGLPDNLPRVLPEGLQAHIDASTWTIPPVFKWICAAGGGVPAMEMARTFNLGVGMVVVVGAADAEAVAASIRSNGVPVSVIGSLRARADGAAHVEIDGLDAALA